jgi:hypothetical protein
VVADAAQHAQHRADKAYMEHWLGQLDVAKIPRAVLSRGMCTVSVASLTTAWVLMCTGGET